ncbi:transposase [Nocardia vinacea]|uniref:Transposase n=1 Tax=Nocardia vinacea TaxID=96468 RepID=A0ABZ1YRD2_9NOCA|nr:transposase [Nocardia vinacea]
MVVRGVLESLFGLLLPHLSGVRVDGVDTSGRTIRLEARSNLLTGLLTKVALALGGRAGQRMTGHLAADVSRSTLLRMVRALPLPAAGALPAVGVDDFAICKGNIYGTVIIDMATHRPVDLLDDRTSDTLATWLRDHPEIRVVCRDRGGPYAEGARVGAPAAIQVADRWHLMHNLTKAVDEVARAHRKDLVPQQDTSQDAQPGAQQPEPGQPTPKEQTSAPGLRAETTRQRHDEIHALLAQGMGIAAIGRTLHLTRKTVRRYARAAAAEHLLTGPPNAAASSTNTLATCCNDGTKAAQTPPTCIKSFGNAATRAARGRCAD